MSSSELASWAQALVATIAVLIAIWTVRHQAGVERDNRIVDDAAFASYIDEYLTKDIKYRIESIVINEEFNNKSLVKITEHVMTNYKSQIIDRMKKLSDLPLTDWPDIEFANAFYDTYLQMESSFALLSRNFEDARQEVMRKNAESEAQALSAAHWEQRQREQDEDDAVEELGAVEDGRAIILPPPGERRRFADFISYQRTSDDEPFDTAEEVRNQDRDYMADWERLWERQADWEAIDTFRAVVLDRLNEISAAWSFKDKLLRQTIDRYIKRAERFNLPTTYEGRAERPKKLTSIFP